MIDGDESPTTRAPGTGADSAESVDATGAPVAVAALAEGVATGGGVADGEDVASPPGKTDAGPKMVGRVVVSYQLGWLPGDWLQTWRRLDRLFSRAGLAVKATLAPLEDLPADTDILVVPPELREAARAAVPPGTPILITPAGAAPGAFAELVKRLQEGTDFTAERVDPDAADKPKIVSYRGHTIID